MRAGCNARTRRLDRVYEYFLTRFVSAEGKNGGQRDQAAVYGQESNATTRRLAVMNLAIRGSAPTSAPSTPTPSAQSTSTA